MLQILFPLLAACLLAAAPFARADAPEAPSGREIMERVDDRPRGRDQVLRATWRLVDRSGRERVRETRSYWRDARGEDDGLRSQHLLVFDAPSEIRETAFLVWSRRDPEADDARWIYLPALRKVRRVASGDRGNSFVGTDFSYEDLAERSLEEDTFRLLREEALEGRRHLVVEAVPKREDDPYARRVIHVDPERWTESRIEYYEEDGELEKVLEIDWQDTDGIATWKRLEMRRENGHRTVVEVDEVALDEDLGKDVFTEGTLRFGAP